MTDAVFSFKVTPIIIPSPIIVLLLPSPRDRGCWLLEVLVEGASADDASVCFSSGLGVIILRCVVTSMLKELMILGYGIRILNYIIYRTGVRDNRNCCSISKLFY